jgi:hypothetical protein
VCVRFFAGALSVNRGWVDRWKKRHGIVSLKFAGEGASVQEEDYKEWKEVLLSNILRQFSPEDLFNLDETGFFWRMMPNSS